MTDPEIEDQYRTVAVGPEVETRVKGSRFRAQAFPVRDEEQAHARLHEVRECYHDATHHCSAWRVGPPERNDERFDDDGEPSGSAGRPILAQIIGAGVYGTMVVVTRWFGGTKLGTGGLVRAYGDAARQALERAPRRVVRREVTVEIQVEYGDLGQVEAVLGRRGEDVASVERDFEGNPRFRVRLPRSHENDFLEELREATAGRARATTVARD